MMLFFFDEILPHSKVQYNYILDESARDTLLENFSQP